MRQRFVILADIHLSAPEGQVPGQNLRYVPGLLRRAVSGITRANPDQVLLLGDIVNRGNEREYELVRPILQPLEDRLEPMIGNHELLEGTTADFERQFRVRAARRLFVGGHSAVLLNSGIEGLPVSEWGGRVPGEQLRLIEEASADAPHAPLLLFCHHPLSGTVRRSDEPMMGLDNSGDLRDRLERHPGPVVLFSGHCHYQSVVRLDRTDRAPIVCVGCPSLAFWPHAFLAVESSPGQLRLETVVLIAEPGKSPDPRALDSAYRERAEGAPDDRDVTIPLRGD